MFNLIKIELHFPQAFESFCPRYNIERITFYDEANLEWATVDVKSFQNGQDFCFIRVFNPHIFLKHVQHLSFVISKNTANTSRP